MTAPIVTSPRTAIWSRVGTPVADAVTAESAIRTAGLDWSVVATQLHRETQKDSGDFVPVARQALVRDDTNAILGYSGLDYGIIQNIRAFEVLNPLVDSGLAKYVRAGALGGGARVFVQVEFDFENHPVIQEVYADRGIVPFGTFLNDHTGGARCYLGESNVCIWCGNTFAQALAGFRAGKLPSVAITHTKGAEVKLVEAAQKIWESIIERNTYLANAYKALRVAKLDDAMFLKLVGEPLIGAAPKEESKDFILNRYAERQNGLLKLWHGDATGLDGDASAYDAWMVATEALDHDPAGIFGNRKVEMETVLIGAKADRKNEVFLNLTREAAFQTRDAK